MTRVLIADDEPANRYFLRALLEGHGLEVEDVADGAMALAAARLNPPDLIISDLLMPVIDGYSLLRHWRADPPLKDIPFIVFTATYTSPQDERLAMALGADAFLVKPAEPEAILALLNEVLARRAGEDFPSSAAMDRDERALLLDYIEVLLTKLQKKVQEAEQTNRELRREIAERQGAQEELRKREARFRATFEHAAVGIAHVDLDGRFTWVNDRLCEMTGFSSEQLLGMTFRDLTPPEDLAQSEEGVRAMLDGVLKVMAIDKRYRRQDGGAIWVRLVSTLLRDPEGRPDHCVTVFLDITEQRRFEEELRLRDRAIRAVSQGILISDPRQPGNPIIYAGPAVETITGYRPEEVLGRSGTFLLGPDTDPEAARVLKEAIAAGKPCALEILNHRKDGTTFWNALTLDPVRDDSGALAYYVGVHNDITSRRRLEEELRQSQKMEAIGKLAGGVAHDFNNHLTVILGCSEMLLGMPDLPEAMAEPLRAITGAGDRAAELTRQLLGFSRQSMLQPKVIDLNTLVGDTARLLTRLIGENIDLRTVLAPKALRVKVDPAQLDQVLMNLAVNARDAMPQGGTLTLETARIVLTEEDAAAHIDGRPGAYAMLVVTDNGQGMTPEVQRRIFEPFFTTKEIGKGTGLGLATVLGIIQQSQGFVRVYSEPKLGTTFRIYLPAVDEEVTPSHEAVPAAHAPGSETILVVEDNDALRDLALTGLRRQGYTVLAAKDGQEALALAEGADSRIDLVLTDVVMPRMGGPEMVERLRARFPSVKALFMSGYTGDAVVRLGLMGDSVAFIQKPFGPRALMHKLREILDGRG